MTPLERAARAAAKQYGEDWARLPVANPLANGELDREHFIEQARAVLAAIREPSEVMVNAAVMSTVEVWDDERDAAREFRTEFTASIDAMLEEG